jgi:hypothetical protein
MTFSAVVLWEAKMMIATRMKERCVLKHSHFIHLIYSKDAEADAESVLDDEEDAEIEDDASFGSVDDLEGAVFLRYSRCMLTYFSR